MTALAILRLIPWQGWALAGAVALMGALYWSAYQSGQDDAQRAADEATQQRKEDISDAINSCADLTWRERLHCAPE